MFELIAALCFASAGAEAPAEASVAVVAPAEQAPAVPGTSGAAPWAVWSGTGTTYAPFTLPQGDLELSFPVVLGGRVDSFTSAPVDSDRTLLEGNALAHPLARLAAKVTWGYAKGGSYKLGFDYEHDVALGTFGSRTEITGTALPRADGYHNELRKLLVRASFGPVFNLSAGVNTSHWGLGLVANDGAHLPDPGAARFADPRSGDRMLRAQAAVGLHKELAIVGSVGGDRLLDDDQFLTARELDPKNEAKDGDTGYQVFAALLVGYNKPTSGGFYFVRRMQEAADGGDLDAYVLDVFGQTKQQLGTMGSFRLGAEATFITGDTSFAASPLMRSQRVRQFGGALQAGLDLGQFGGAFDFLYASGDQNLDDKQQNGFRVDPNYEMGFILFRHVLAAQTGRATATAGNPELVGNSPYGLERFPSRGGATNTLAFFPRAFVRPLDGLEVYGGPMFAFAEVPLVDPLNTRLSGGTLKNSLNGPATGSYYGTEYDVGVRYRGLLSSSELMVGIEGGVFVPGDAFENDNGGRLRNVRGGRVLMMYRL